MSILDINDAINNDDSLIRQFIGDNYDIYGTYNIKNGVFNGSNTVIVDVDGSICVKNKNIKSLISELFSWGRINGSFSCYDCNKLESLEGVPKECKEFYCNFCNNLKSLKGAPEKCEGFYCNNCKNLISLEGAPEKCKEFYCNFCNNLKSLKGSPKRCDMFDCANCKKLETLEGAPEECGYFVCPYCRKLPNESELKRLYPQYKYIYR